jgi:hypothetical protein
MLFMAIETIWRRKENNVCHCKSLIFFFCNFYMIIHLLNIEPRLTQSSNLRLQAH